MVTNKLSRPSSTTLTFWYTVPLTKIAQKAVVICTHRLSHSSSVLIFKMKALKMFEKLTFLGKIVSRERGITHAKCWIELSPFVSRCRLSHSTNVLTFKLKALTVFEKI